MFTGIITHLGKVESIYNSKYIFSSDGSFFRRLRKGNSVAVNGICLTVESSPQMNRFSVEIMPETIRKTMISTLKVGNFVNLELPMSANTFFEGHIVQGHVDSTGTIGKIQPEGNSHIITIKVKPEISHYLVDKGAISVNGISLTIICAEQSFFTIGIIPHTWRHTMLQYAKTGQLVNIEVDVFAKYVEKFIRLQRKKYHEFK